MQVLTRAHLISLSEILVPVTEDFVFGHDDYMCTQNKR